MKGDAGVAFVRRIRGRPAESLAAAAQPLAPGSPRHQRTEHREEREVKEPRHDKTCDTVSRNTPTHLAGTFRLCLPLLGTKGALSVSFMRYSDT